MYNSTTVSTSAHASLPNCDSSCAEESAIAENVHTLRQTTEFLGGFRESSFPSTVSYFLPECAESRGLQEAGVLKSETCADVFVSPLTDISFGKPNQSVETVSHVNDQLGPGSQVLFVLPESVQTDTFFSAPWELGRVIEIVPLSATCVKGSGTNTMDDRDIFVVKRVTKGLFSAEKNSLVQTTRACVRPYSYEGSLWDIDDLCTLPDPSEAGLLYALKQRYYNGLYYTFTGRVMLAFNPYEHSVPPPHVPHPRHVAKAVKEALCISRKKNDGDRLCEGKDVAKDDTPDELLQRPVALVVTGDSGAGKTETTKLVIQHLFEHVTSSGEEALSPRPAFIDLSTSVSGRIFSILEATNCLLESFGNASTPLNDNSSRFAKCVTLFLDPQTGENVGAHVECYLLEVSRLVSRSLGESTFHIFNMLFAERDGLTAEEKGLFDIWDPALFRAMHSDGADLHLGSSPHTLSQVRVALKLLGLAPEKITAVVRVLCGILHFLNIEFTARDLFSPAAVSPASKSSCKRAAELLGFSFADDTHTSLEALLTTVSLGKNIRLLNCVASKAARDATAKLLYESLFRYILSCINEALAPFNTGEMEYAKFLLFDIFGFEVKGEEYGGNDLEQLLINYANEEVQHLYEETTFASLRAEIAREGVVLDFPKEWDLGRNDTFELFVQRPKGVLSVINDDSLLAQQSQHKDGENLAGLLLSLNSFFPNLIKPVRLDPAKVSIQHYCANVVYDVKNMLLKNRVSTAADMICASTSDAFVLGICDCFLANSFQQSCLPFKNGEEAKAPAPRMHATTLIAKFRLQIEALVKQLRSCTIFWIRCIKPNMHKKPQEFDSALVFLQLKHGAIFKSFMLFGMGYCHSFDYKTFALRYLFLAVWGYCCDALLSGGNSKERVISASLSEAHEGSLLHHHLSLELFLKKQKDAFYAAVHRASFREACVLVTKFVPCCMGNTLLLGASKVFLRSGTLRALLAMDALASKNLSSLIGRVGRAFIGRRSLAAVWFLHNKEKRQAAIRERIAKEMPEREALERDRESLLNRSSEERVGRLAFLSRRSMKLTRRLGRHWKESAELLGSELAKALLEMDAYDESRFRKEKEAREAAEMIKMYKARAMEAVNRGRSNQQPKRRTVQGSQSSVERDAVKGKAGSCSKADIDAKREKIIRTEIIRARQLELRAEQEVLMKEREREARLRERHETRQIRQHLDRQQQRIASQVRIEEENVERRRAASRLCIREQSPFCLSSFCFREPKGHQSSAAIDRATNEATVATGTGRMAVSSSLQFGWMPSYFSGSCSGQKETTSSTFGSGHDGELEWEIQKDMVALWESLHNVSEA